MKEKAEAEWKRQELEEQLKQQAERAAAAEEARAMFEENWRAGKPPGIASLTPEQIKQAKSNYLDGKAHIAFVGMSGTGKSTLVNSVRGLRASAAGAALVSQNEGTRKIDRYTDPLHPQHVWYDVPGAGTLECPDWQYFMDKELYVYDALVIVFSDRIMQNDMRVLWYAEELGIPTFLVRSKSDQIMRNMESDYEEDANAAKVRYLRTTHSYVREVLGQAESDENKKVYMISREVMLQVVKGGTAKTGLDEQQLLGDLLKVQGGQ
jgi:GTP-binding protein EngB required for normal cell division